VKCLRSASKTRRRMLLTEFHEQPRKRINIQYCPEQEPRHKRQRRPPTWNSTTFTVYSRMGKDPHSSMCRRRRRRSSNNNKRKYFYGHKIVLFNRLMDETPLQPRKCYSKRQTMFLDPRPRNPWSLPLEEACQPEQARHFFFGGTLPTHLRAKHLRKPRWQFCLKPSC
jgi:hypothetical protein